MSESLADAPTGWPEQVGPLVAHPAQGSFAWEDPPRSRPPATSPVLVVDGFEGPLDWLLEMARAKQIDLARLSILALVEAFAAALEKALARAPTSEMPAPASSATSATLAPTALADLLRWAAWTVMAAQLTELRSRLLLPPDAPEARTALTEAEALRQQWLDRAATAAAADWLEARPQFGFEVFARGRPETFLEERAPTAEAAPRDDEAPDHLDLAEHLPGDADDDLPVAGGDLTDLLRACLVALRLPPDAATYRPLPPPFWSTSDAAARINRLLDRLPDGATLGALLPEIAEASANRVLRCRAALSATLIAGLELTRGGALTLEQETPWRAIHVRRRAGSTRNANAEPTSTAAFEG